VSGGGGGGLGRANECESELGLILDKYYQSLDS
jgi:hypothetical protein